MMFRSQALLVNLPSSRNTPSSQVGQQDQGHAKGQGASAAALRQGLHSLQLPLHEIQLGHDCPAKSWENGGDEAFFRACLVDD